MAKIFKIIPATTDARDPKAFPAIGWIKEHFTKEMNQQCIHLDRLCEDQSPQRIANQWQVLPMTLVFHSPRRRNPCKFIKESDVFEWFRSIYVFSETVSREISALCSDSVELLPVTCCERTLYAVRPLLKVSNDCLNEDLSEFWNDGHDQVLI